MGKAFSDNTLRLLGYACIALTAGALFGLLKLSGLLELPFVKLGLLVVMTLGALWFLIADAFGLLCVVLALMPFTRGFAQFELGVVTFSPFTMGLIVLFVVSLGAIALGYRKLSLSIMDVMLAGVCLFYMGTTLLSPTMIETGYLAFHALFIPVTAYVSIRILAHTPERARICLFFMLGGILVFDVACLAQFAVVQERVYMMRVTPVSVGTITLPAIFVLLYTDMVRQPYRALLLLCALGAFAVTFSRLYTLALLLSPLMMRAIRRGGGRSLYLGIMALSLVATLAVAFVIPASLGDQSRDRGAIAMLRSVKEQEQSAARMTSPALMLKALDARALEYWDGLLEFTDHPVLGTGLMLGERMVTQHNLHIEWLLYSGVIGYFFYFSTLLAFFAKFRMEAREPLVAVCTLSVIFVVINSITNGIMHGFSPYLVFICIGLCHSLTATPDDGGTGSGAWGGDGFEDAS